MRLSLTLLLLATSAVSWPGRSRKRGHYTEKEQPHVDATGVAPADLDLAANPITGHIAVRDIRDPGLVADTRAPAPRVSAAPSDDTLIPDVLPGAHMPATIHAPSTAQAGNLVAEAWINDDLEALTLLAQRHRPLAWLCHTLCWMSSPDPGALSAAHDALPDAREGHGSTSLDKLLAAAHLDIDVAVHGATYCGPITTSSVALAWANDRLADPHVRGTELDAVDRVLAADTSLLARVLTTDLASRRGHPAEDFDDPELPDAWRAVLADARCLNELATGSEAATRTAAKVLAHAGWAGEEPLEELTLNPSAMTAAECD